MAGAVEKLLINAAKEQKQLEAFIEELDYLIDNAEPLFGSIGGNLKGAKEAIGVKKILPEPTISIAESEVLKNTKYRQIEQALGTKTQPNISTKTIEEYDKFDLGFGGGGDEWVKTYRKPGDWWAEYAEKQGLKTSSVNSANGSRVGVIGNLKGAWGGVLNWMDDGFKGGAKGIMPSLIGAGIGTAYGFVGNVFAPDNIQVQNPMKSALMGAAAGFGLGALGGAAGGVKAVNKFKQGFMYHAANKTQKWANSKVTSLAIGTAAYAGSKDTSFTSPLNRNSHV